MWAHLQDEPPTVTADRPELPARDRRGHRPGDGEVAQGALRDLHGDGRGRPRGAPVGLVIAPADVTRAHASPVPPADVTRVGAAQRRPAARRARTGGPAAGRAAAAAPTAAAAARRAPAQRAMRPRRAGARAAHRSCSARHVVAAVAGSLAGQSGGDGDARRGKPARNADLDLPTRRPGRRVAAPTPSRADAVAAITLRRRREHRRGADRESRPGAAAGRHDGERDRHGLARPHSGPPPPACRRRRQLRRPCSSSPPTMAPRPSPASASRPRAARPWRRRCTCARPGALDIQPSQAYATAPDRGCCTTTPGASAPTAARWRGGDRRGAGRRRGLGRPRPGRAREAQARPLRPGHGRARPTPRSSPRSPGSHAATSASRAARGTTPSATRGRRDAAPGAGAPRAGGQRAEAPRLPGPASG